jgi:hypothetical protein
MMRPTTMTVGKHIVVVVVVVVVVVPLARMGRLAEARFRMGWVAAPLHTNQSRATGSMVMGVMWPRKHPIVPRPSGSYDVP